MIKQHYYLLTCLIFGFVLSGCGGGSSSDDDNSTPTDPNKVFSLEVFRSTTVGTVYSTSLTGSDSNGTAYTGSYSVSNSAETMYSGTLAIPTDLLISLTSSGTSLTVTGTSYRDSSNGYLLAVIIQTTGVTCIPSMPDTEFPISVTIGDFGISPDLVCDNNTTQSQNWRVEDGRDGKIKFIASSVIRNSSTNSIESTTDITYTIDGSYNIVAFKTSSALSNGYRLTYQSI